MPRCTICTHSASDELDRRIALGQDSLTDIAAEYGVSIDAVVRHRRNHLAPALIEASDRMAAQRTERKVTTLLEDVEWVRRTSKRAIREALRPKPPAQIPPSVESQLTGSSNDSQPLPSVPESSIPNADDDDDELLVKKNPHGVAAMITAHVKILELKGKVTGEFAQTQPDRGGPNGAIIVMIPPSSLKGGSVEDLLSSAPALAPALAPGGGGGAQTVTIDYQPAAPEADLADLADSPSWQGS